MNSYEKIYSLLVEGVASGDDPWATGVRVGNFVARKDKTVGNLTKIMRISQRLELRGHRRGGSAWKRDYLHGMKLGLKGEQRRRKKGRTSGPFDTGSIKDQPLN
jgi:hypothetical protein